MLWKIPKKPSGNSVQNFMARSRLIVRSFSYFRFILVEKTRSPNRHEFCTQNVSYNCCERENK